MRKRGDELTERERLYAQARATGMSMAKSYHAAGYAKLKTKHAQAKGALIEKRPRVQAYLEQIRELHLRNAQMTLVERRTALASIVRATPNDINAESALASVSVDGDGKMTLAGPKVSDKLKAIELDSRLAGDLQGEDQSNQVLIQLVNERLDAPDLTIPANALEASAVRSLEDETA
jgi:hypothetical protein